MTRRPSSPRPRSRRSTPHCEALEGRALLSVAPTALSRVGTIEKPAGSATVLLPISVGQFTPPASGKIQLDIEVQPADGSRLAVAPFRIVGPSGNRVAATQVRSGRSMEGYAALGLGDYSIAVRGRGASTGGFVVLVRLLGDVDGSGGVDKSDLGAISLGQGALRGSRQFSAALDANHSGGVGPMDVALARRNLGANAGQSFRLLVKNDTAGAFAADKVYIAVTGLDPQGQFCHIDASGNLVPMKGSDNTHPIGALSYADYSIKLSDFNSSGLPIPQIVSGRIWIGLGSPVWFHVFESGGRATGYTQPNPANPTDPNAATDYDFIEFTLDGAGFNGNTTQVDQFGFPMTLNVAGDANKTVGITEPRSALFSAFAQAVPAEFKGLVDPAGYRILSPKNGSTFPKGYYTQYIADTWAYYQTHSLSVDTIFGTFTGTVQNDVFVFRRDGDAASYLVQRPTSAEVIASDGSLKTGNAQEQAIKARISAMFNRHVAQANVMSDPSQYYLTAPANFYSKFWHAHSINNKAYGFDFDDVYDQNSSIIDAHPRIVTVDVTWG